MAALHPQTLSRIALFVGLIVAMAVGAQINIPMHPVPMTLQSLAILLAGLCLGPGLGLLTVLTYLALALIGLPILSGGTGGLGPFTGATAGYLYAFPLAAGLAGLLARSHRARQPLFGIGTLFGLHMVLLAVGTAWLAGQMPLSQALSIGFTPFLIGAAVKSGLAWSLWRAPNLYRAYSLRRAETG